MYKYIRIEITSTEIEREREVCKTNIQGEMSTSKWGRVRESPWIGRRTPRRRSRKSVFGYFVAISIRNGIDVGGRL
jgi:hypothetical protein